MDVGRDFRSFRKLSLPCAEVRSFPAGWLSLPQLCFAHHDKHPCSDVAGDNYWVIDTDYDNYAITYACRSLKEDGSCDDGYSLIFSRNPRGLPPAIQRIVRQKQEEICMSGQFQPVLQSGTLG